MRSARGWTCSDRCYDSNLAGQDVRCQRTSSFESRLYHYLLAFEPRRHGSDISAGHATSEEADGCSSWHSLPVHSFPGICCQQGCPPLPAAHTRTEYTAALIRDTYAEASTEALPRAGVHLGMVEVGVCLLSLCCSWRCWSVSLQSKHSSMLMQAAGVCFAEAESQGPCAHAARGPAHHIYSCASVLGARCPAL